MPVIVTDQAPDFPQTQQRLLHKLVCGEGLSRRDSGDLFHIILSGGATPAQIAAVLTALSLKGETEDHLTGAAEAMLGKCKPFPVTFPCVDVCGTGGDNANTLNISTAAAILTAAVGLPVVKHGNRAVSSSSGSQDVLSSLNVNTGASEAAQMKALTAAGICFLSAPLYHPALRHVMPIRQELRFRTIFNLLGPLVNPARPPFRLAGVYAQERLQPMAAAFKALGASRALVVCSEDGWDEVSPCSRTHICELRLDGTLRLKSLTPADFGLRPFPPEALLGGSPADNAHELRELLKNRGRPAYRAAALMNAGCALYVAGKAPSPSVGYQMADKALADGLAERCFNTLQTALSS